MDYILLPCPSEELRPEQIAVVNGLRMRLATIGRTGAANALIKSTFAEIASRWAVSSLCDWGCGFDSVAWRTSVPVTFGVDIDPEVIHLQNSVGFPCFEPTSSSLQDFFGVTDLVVCVFVFHFRFDSMHAGVLTNLLTSEGVLLANVYRRKEASIANLAIELEKQGLVLHRRRDPLQLCDGHELWLASKCPDTESLSQRMDEVEALLAERGQQASPL